MEPTAPTNDFDFVTKVGALPPEALIRFYEVLEHNLTVSVRAVWSDESLTDAQKVERMKWLNEIMHRITMKTAALRMNRNDRSEADTWNMIQDYLMTCPDLTPTAQFAITFSYQTVERLFCVPPTND